MALDKQFLKYKLEKIKNDRIDKNMERPAKIYQREFNGRLAQEEAEAIHTYLGAEDTDGNDNSSITTEDVFFPYDDQTPASLGGIIPAVKSEKVPIKEYIRSDGVTKSFITKTYRMNRIGSQGLGYSYNIEERYAKVTMTNGIVTDISTINLTGTETIDWGY